MKSEKSNNLLLILFILFSILIKLFSSSSYFFISMDETKYLKLAKNLPFYNLFNNNFYISHPPFYPFVIKMFSFIMSDYIAGISLSQISTIGFILTGCIFLKLLKTEYRNLYIIITLTGLSHLLYYWSNIIYKETFFSFLVYLFLLCFFLVIIKPQKILVVFTAIIGFLLSFTSDLVIFLFPSILCMILLYGKSLLRNKQYSVILLPIISIVTGYGIWIGIRLWIYTHNTYYPAGVDGMIEQVASWNIFHIFSPRSFQWTKEITQSGLSLEPLHYIKYISALFNLLPPLHISLTSFSTKEIFLILIVYIPLAIFMCIGIFTVIQNKEKTGYLMLVTFFSFLSPIIFQISDPRFSLPSLIPLFYFIGTGIMKVCSKMKSELLILPFFVFSIFWIIQNPYFYGFKQKVVQLEKTGKFINNLTEDGIMAQFGYPPEIAYLTDKRVICLPLTVEELEHQLSIYDIHYIIFGEDETYNGKVINYIKNSPQEFTKITEIEEIYPHQKEKVYVFKVKK